MTKERYEKINELNTYIVEGGSGQTLLMLHGWGGTSEVWNPNIDELSKTYHCVAVDLPIHGNGKSENPQDIWNVSKYETYTNELVNKLNLDNFILIGKSFGGRVAIKYAVDHPEKLAGLILVSAAGIEKKDLTTNIKIAVAKIGKATIGLIPFISEKNIQEIYYKVLGIKEDPNSLRMETKKAVVSEDLSDYLKNIKVPTLVVWGENDKVLPLRVGEELASRIPNAKLEIIKDGTHSVHKEKPYEFNKIVSEFVDGLNGY